MPGPTHLLVVALAACAVKVVGSAYFSVTVSLLACSMMTVSFFDGAGFPRAGFGGFQAPANVHFHDHWSLSRGRVAMNDQFP